MAASNKLTSLSLRARKSDKHSEKIVTLTCYDFSFARLFDELVDVLLVGDTLGMVMQGNKNTLAVTVDDIAYHCRAVSNGIVHAHLVADMPFMSYQASTRDAIRNAGKLMTVGKAEAVKLEGGVNIARTVAKIVDVGIPVMGHVGLQPQRVHAMGGYKIQGKTATAAESILQDALAIEDAGAYSVVLEGIPADLAGTITKRLKIPTIGIGAGPRCDGQVLVMQDMLGMNPDFSPKFLKKYARLDEVVRDAVQTFRDEVREGVFPGADQSH